ncbi:hypothetical protein PUN28_013802 [Cardiocondyla obscurior]|uniref:Uncharacterized protein n=1 Tax=Cardiocondyla obscurior TaxID=286306 RepID=A0AAW2F6R2_9HYME
MKVFNILAKLFRWQLRTYASPLSPQKMPYLLFGIYTYFAPSERLCHERSARSVQLEASRVQTFPTCFFRQSRHQFPVSNSRDYSNENPAEVSNVINIESAIHTTYDSSVRVLILTVKYRRDNS